MRFISGLITVCLVLAAGCGADRETENGQQAAVRVVNGTVTADGLQLHIMNNTDARIFWFDLYYTVERLENGKWVAVEPIAERSGKTFGWADFGRWSFDAGRVLLRAIHWNNPQEHVTSPHYGSLDDGEYRLLIILRNDADGGWQSSATVGFAINEETERRYQAARRREAERFSELDVEFVDVDDAGLTFRVTNDSGRYGYIWSSFALNLYSANEYTDWRTVYSYSNFGIHPGNDLIPPVIMPGETREFTAEWDSAVLESGRYRIDIDMMLDVEMEYLITNDVQSGGNIMSFKIEFGVD
jgi:hypothetical protein